MSVPRLVEIQPRDHFGLWVKFADGSEGVADLSDVAGQGVFELWNVPGEFEKARIGSAGEIRWRDKIDICPDTIYFEITGKKPDEFFKQRKMMHA